MVHALEEEASCPPVGHPAVVSVIGWLLDGDPVIRWQALSDLTDAPAGEVAAERAWRFFDGEVGPCINGRTIETGAYFGVDVAAVVERILAERLADGGWNCEAENGSVRSSFDTTINVLDGLAEFERTATEMGPGTPGTASPWPRASRARRASVNDPRPHSPIRNRAARCAILRRAGGQAGENIGSTPPAGQAPAGGAPAVRSPAGARPWQAWQRWVVPGRMILGWCPGV